MMDNLNQRSDDTYCVGINVLPVNDPPVIVPEFETQSSTIAGVSMCENGDSIMEFDLEDVDDEKEVLTAQVSLLPAVNTANTRGSKLYWCTEESGEEASCYAEDHEISKDNRTIPAFPTRPGHFKLIFVPAPDTSSGLGVYTTFAITGFDDNEDFSNRSVSLFVNLRVRPLNDPPEIVCPSNFTISNTDLVVLQPIEISDPDALYGTELKLDVMLLNDTGVLGITSDSFNFFAATDLQDALCTYNDEPPVAANPDLFFLNEENEKREAEMQAAIIYSFTCIGSEESLSKFVADSMTFTPNEDEIASHALISITVNDLGNTGGID